MSDFQQRLDFFNAIVIHHSATPKSIVFEQIDSAHRARGWEGCGYHYVIETDGKVVFGRQLPLQGAHCPPNCGRIGICVTGDNTNEDESWGPSQWASLIDLVVSLLKVFPIAESAIVRHCELRDTKCPGIPEEDWEDFLFAVKERTTMRGLIG